MAGIIHEVERTDLLEQVRQEAADAKNVKKAVFDALRPQMRIFLGRDALLQ